MTRRTPRLSWTTWLGASLALLLIAVPGWAAEPWLSFSGEAKRGETFRHQLDGDLWFALRPDPQGWGWHIWIGDPREPQDDYAAVETPPYHGVNPLQLYGWHFGNSDITGANTPQEERSFSFVLNGGDHDRAAAALARLLWGPVESEDVARHLQTWRRALAKGAGRLEITDMTLGNLSPGEIARFERIAFTVTLAR